MYRYTQREEAQSMLPVLTGANAPEVVMTVNYAHGKGSDASHTVTCDRVPVSPLMSVDM